MTPKHPPGPPMTLGNMRQNGVRGLAVYCLNHACQHRGAINVDDYAADIEVPSFGLAHEVQQVRSAWTLG